MRGNHLKPKIGRPDRHVDKPGAPGKITLGPELDGFTHADWCDNALTIRTNQKRLHTQECTATTLLHLAHQGDIVALVLDGDVGCGRNRVDPSVN